MAKHPFHDVAIAGVFNSQQARVLESHTSATITLEAIRGVIDESGVAPEEIDGISVGGGALNSAQFAYLLGAGPAWRGASEGRGIAAILEAAAAIATGRATTVLVAAGSAGIYTERASTAPWTRPGNEFVVSWGLFTAAEFALIARRHMHTFGTTPEHLATVSATIRNNGHINPDAVYRGRGPFTPADILASRMVADPLRLFDYCLESDGACAVLITTAERARELRQRPAYIMSGAWGAAPAMSGLMGRREYPIDEEPAARSMAAQLFERAGVTPKDIKVAQIYDHFTALVLTSLESLGFCKVGEGGPFVEGGRLEWPHGDPIVNTAGGHLSEGYIHGMNHMNEAVRQIRGTSTSQVEGADLGLVMSAMPPSPQGVNAGLILRR